MPTNKIAIVTDSTCELIPAQLKEHDIFVVPLKICFGTEEFWDREDISPEQFYQKLRTLTLYPRTLQPTSKRFFELFQALEEKGYTQIFCVFISSAISKTIEAAHFAANMITKAKIEIVDSKLTSYGLGFLALYARSLVRQGMGLEDIVNKVKSKIPTTLMLFSLENLTALERGGRIGKASAFFGNLLGVRPVLAFRNGSGKIEVVAKVNSTQAAHETMATLAEEHIKKHGLLQGIAVMNCDVAEHCQALKQILYQKGIQRNQIVDGRVGSVVGTHLGADGWGMVVF